MFVISERIKNVSNEIETVKRSQIKPTTSETESLQHRGTHQAHTRPTGQIQPAASFHPPGTSFYPAAPSSHYLTSMQAYNYTQPFEGNCEAAVALVKMSWTALLYGIE